MQGQNGSHIPKIKESVQGFVLFIVTQNYKEGYLFGTVFVSSLQSSSPCLLEIA